MNRIERSPHAIYAEHCSRGELAYQVSVPDGKPVFPPRVVAPGTGGALEWRVSRGRGRVYATTTLHRRGEAPYNVALVDLDEGFRMMSALEGIAPESVDVGMRVEVRFHEGAGGEPPFPVFVPAVDGR
jgi:uncharacterized OB-fold protein